MMPDMFKTDTLNESMVHGRSKNLEPISECPPVPAPKKPQKPKIAERKENKQRSYKLPGPVDGPDTEAGLARWENPTDLNKFIDPLPEQGDAFDALMGHRRKEAGNAGGRRRTSGSSRNSSRRRPQERAPDSFSDLARALLLSDSATSNRRPPPFRGV